MLAMAAAFILILAILGAGSAIFVHMWRRPLADKLRVIKYAIIATALVCATLFIMASIVAMF